MIIFSRKPHTFERTHNHTSICIASIHAKRKTPLVRSHAQILIEQYAVFHRHSIICISRDKKKEEGEILQNDKLKRHWEMPLSYMRRMNKVRKKTTTTTKHTGPHCVPTTKYFRFYLLMKSQLPFSYFFSRLAQS